MSIGVDPDTGIQFVHSQYNSVDPVCSPVDDLSTNSPIQSNPEDEALFEECKVDAGFSLV